jgi:Uma2 family endonuclease
MTALEKSFDWISPADYLAGEPLAETKHEYIDGKVYAMAGATRAHNIIAANAMIVIGNHLRGKPCQPFGSDMRVRLPSTVGDIYYYPDLSVTCDPTDTNDLYIEKPVLIIEVLSPETRRTDLREKRLAYFSIPTVQTYLMLEQDSPNALILERIQNAWVEKVANTPDSEIHLTPINLKTPLKSFYPQPTP